MSTADPALTDPAQSGLDRPSTLFYVLLGAALLVLIQTFAQLAPILLSLLLILLISLALNPVIARMRSWTGGRKGAAVLLALAMAGIMGLTGWAFSVPMKDSVSEFAERLPEYWERLQKPLIRLEQQAESFEEKLQAEVTTEIALEEAAAGELDAAPSASLPAAMPESDSESGSVRSGLGQMLGELLGRFAAVAFNGAQILVVLVTAFFGVFYMLMNPLPIFGAMFSLVPARHHEKALTIMRRIGEFVPRWAGATLVGMMAVGTLVVLLMWPLFGLMDALVLGLIAGMLGAIPYLGPVLSAVPALLLALGEGGMTPLWVVLAYLGIQALENNVIVPFVMAQGLKLHPLAVIFSMLLCVVAFGVLGVLVAAPLVAIVSILHEELYRKRFLSTVTDTDLDRLSRDALDEEAPAIK